MKIIAFLSILSITGFLLGPLLSWAGVLPGLAGFGIFALGMIISVLAWFSGGIYMAKKGPTPLIYFLIPSAIPLIFFVYSLYASRNYPPINDITTDSKIPPAFTEAKKASANEGRDMEYPQAFIAQAEKAYPDLQSLPLLQTPDQILGTLSDFIKAQESWEKKSTNVTEKEIIVEGTATSSVFGFVDDFIVRITATNGGSVVDIRSKSRDGQGDFGANAQRIRDILNAIR